MTTTAVERRERVEPTPPVASGPASTSEPYAPLDLFLDADTLARQLVTHVEQGRWWDAYLLAAGLCQVVEDAVPAWLYGLRRIRGASASRDGGLHHAARLAAAGGEAVARLLESAPGGGDLSYVEELKALIDRLALRCMAPEFVDHDDPGLADAARRLVRGLERADRHVGRQMLRVPSCFRSFDQRAADVTALVERLERSVDLARGPHLVLGVRTSGSYLAPLARAVLARRGMTSASWTTCRPSWPWDGPTRDRLARLRKEGGRCIVVDDPPTSGAALMTVFRQLGLSGLGRQQLVGLLASFPSSEPALDRLRQVADIVELPVEEWEIRRLLAPDTVCRALAGRLGAGSRIDVRLLAPVEQRDRDHARVAYEVLVDGPGGVVTQTVVAEGVGTGYFGRHALAVARAVPELVPEVVAYDDGVLIRRLAPGEALPGRRPGPPPAPSAIAAHLALRSERLAVSADRSVELHGRQAAWEVAAELVSAVGGPLAPGLRVSVVDHLVRALLRTDDPTVVDGRPALENWHGSRGPARKTDFDAGSFSHHDLASYDPVYDVAGVAVALEDRDLARELRSEFVLRSGRPVDPERWLLLRWVHAWNGRRLGELGPEQWSRRCAAFAQDYFAERFLDDLPPVVDGPWAGLDLDGVLETSPLGFPATTRAGALALRALRAHGCPLVLVTGRSLPEVVERCRSYGALGGVAEYGTVVYDHRSGRTRDVAPFDEELDRRLRSQAEALGLEVDADFTRIVRVGRRQPSGRRRGISEDSVDELLERAGGRYRAVRGEEQTDFVPVDADKAHGLVALQALVGGEGGLPPQGVPTVPFAIGDAPSDAGFLRMAVRRYAPANAMVPVRQLMSAEIAGRYQRGLFDAVTDYLGHAPGSCPRCAPAPLPASATSLLSVLSLQEDGWRGSVGRLIRAAGPPVGRRSHRRRS